MIHSDYDDENYHHDFEGLDVTWNHCLWVGLAAIGLTLTMIYL